MTQTLQAPLETYDATDALAANVIRGLAIDAIQASGGGHPGMPLGMADVAHVLWTRFLRFDLGQPEWWNRDRYVQSAGHGSMLQYALLHLARFDLPMEELKRHRQLHSLTPGHPEYGRTAGVETTTGPLGQGFANAVGMAMAEAMLGARFNLPDLYIVDHQTYVVVGDGDLQEGIAQEAASLAGHFRLGKLIVLLDSNRITIDGPVTDSQSDDTLARFRACGWHVQAVDGHDMRAIDGALQAACATDDRPSLVAFRTIIGFGSPNRQDTPKAHATALGEAEALLTKAALGLPTDQQFWIPEAVTDRWRGVAERGRQRRRDWATLRTAYRQRDSRLAAEFEAAMRGALPEGWGEGMPTWEAGEEVDPREASLAFLECVFPRIDSLVGGSADLSESVHAKPSSAVAIAPDDFRGRYVHWGIREHAMAAAMTGMALHGGIIPYSGTYLAFSDYSRAAVRVGALMGAPVIHLWTHDSPSVGEDGPTHQSVEHVMALRCMPGLVTIRPADASETVAAWQYAIAHRDRPVALLLGKHAVPVLPGTPEEAAQRVARGAYVVADAPAGQPDVLILSAGTEVDVAMQSRGLLRARGVNARVVSMPSWTLFEEQDQAYRDSVLPRPLSGPASRWRPA